MDHQGNDSHHEVGELQRREERRRFQTARLQRAHNRALRCLNKTTRDLADLKRAVEMYGVFGSALHAAYTRWCRQCGVPTPEERVSRRTAALIRAHTHPRDFVCDAREVLEEQTKPRAFQDLRGFHREVDLGSRLLKAFRTRRGDAF